MTQISNNIYCKDFILNLKEASWILTNPYYDYPFLIIEDFFSKEMCELVLQSVNENNEIENAKVKTTLLNSVVNPSVDESIRKTLLHTPSEQIENMYNSAFILHQKKIEDFFNTPLTTASSLQILEYLKGSFYIKHADDSNEIINKDKELIGFNQVAPYRKITSVLFASTCSEDFEGGELLFNYLFDKKGNEIIFRPKAGDMILFPSNPLFSHEVLKVKRGQRVTLVQWHNSIV